MGSVRKKISCRRISRVKKFLQGTTWRKIIPTLEKKILFMVYNAEKKSYTVVCQQKILSPDRGIGKKFFYTNQITHTPPHSPTPFPYFKWSGPYSSNTGYQILSSPKNPSSLYNPPLH